MKLFFDLDGTLLDVSERNYRVYSEITTEFDGMPLDKSTYWDLKRKKTKWPELLPLSKINASQELAFLKKFIAKIEDLEYLKIDTLFPNSLATLNELSKQHDCYLVSLRRNHENLVKQLGWLGLAPHFKEVLSGHSENDGYDVKIELIKSRLNNESGVIIGDTEADIICGKELGLKTIAVTSGIRDEQFLTTLHPDHMVPGIGKIVGLL